MTKAFFTNCDTNAQFDVQYNPKELAFDKPVAWKDQDVQGGTPSLEFQKTSPATLAIELLFDTTNDGGDVRAVWVNKLLEFTNPSIDAQDGQAQDMAKQRPPKVSFGWNGESFDGVITDVKVSYLMFSADGLPLRARVNVAMKEWTHATYTGSGSGSAYGSDPVRLVQIKAGQSISSVAQENGCSTQELLDANPQIDDPLDVAPGTTVVVPMA